MTEQPNPQGIFERIVGFQMSAALATAIELDIFTLIGRGANTCAKLAEASHAHERGVRSLCDYFAATGLLRKHDGVYALTAESAAFLDRASPQCLGSIAEFLHGEMLLAAFGGLTEAVRRGRTSLGERGTMAPEHPAWVSFARGMVPMAAPQAAQLANIVARRGLAPRSVLDIACGHGLYGIAIARAQAQVRLTSQDWKPVLAVAHENAVRAGVAERTTQLAGDAFEVDLGGPHDLALVVNFVHHFTPEDCVRFFTKLRRALAPGGQVCVVEFLVNEDRVTPTPPATFSLVMLATTRGGDAFTEAELRTMLATAGFHGFARVELEGFFASALFATA